jgi:hypothetical protein
MTLYKEPSKKDTIKPFYSSRLAKNKQQAALELQEQRKAFDEEIQNKTTSFIQERTANTFDRPLNLKQQMREKNRSQMQSIKEELYEYVGAISYGGLPLDTDIKREKAPMIQAKVQAMMNELINPAELSASMMSKYNSSISFGNSVDLAVKQVAPFIMNRVKMAESRADIHEMNSRMNVLDFLTMDEQSHDIEGLQLDNSYKKLIEEMSSIVRSKVVQEMKREAEYSDLENFVEQRLQEDVNYLVKNKQDRAKLAKTSLFREMMKNLKSDNKDLVLSEEVIFAEALLEYTIFEALKITGCAKLDEDAYIKKLSKERSKVFANIQK